MLITKSKFTPPLHTFVPFKCIICILICTFFIITSCSEKIDRSMVIGKYIANHKKGVDSLEIKSDGTYVHYYKSPDGEEFWNTNQWEFEYWHEEPLITFSEFISRLPRHGQKTKKGPGFWGVKVEWSFMGKVLLYIDRDLNYYYEKQNN